MVYPILLLIHACRSRSCAIHIWSSTYVVRLTCNYQQSDIADYCNDWNVVFANKSRKLGWIWMQLGRWGWGLKRLSVAHFQRNHTMGFGESTKKWVAEALFFCDVNHAPLLPLSLDRFPQNFPRTRVQVVSRDTWFHIPERFPLRDWISWKTLFLGYPICAQPTGHGKCSVTPTLFPSPSGHSTDVSFLGDFAEGCTVFHLSPSKSQHISNGDTWMGTQ